MLRYYYINREWMLSASAQLIYRSCALLSLILFLILFMLHLHVSIDPRFLPIVRFFLFLGILGTAITMVAMEYFLFGFDNSPAWRKAFWFCLLALPPLGPALYCLTVYSRSALLMKSNPHRGEIHP